MKKTTIVIPARHEIYLQQTVDDILAKARGDIEILIVLDNYWPDPILNDHPNVTLVHWGGRRGMRAAINTGAELGKGDFLMKVDAHCLFEEGFDVTLQENCDVDWLVVPRRYSLRPETWERKPAKERPVIDYEFLHFPEIDGNGHLGLHARNWKERARERTAAEFDIDENMSFQGSCWFMPMNYFRDLCYPMDEENYGMFIGEPQEIGLKVWLSGGKCMINKKTWYAHLWKGQGYRDIFREKYGFGYTRVGKNELRRGNDFSTRFWFNNEWKDRTHDLSWLIDRFSPVPSWPEEREAWTQMPQITTS